MLGYSNNHSESVTIILIIKLHCTIKDTLLFKSLFDQKYSHIVKYYYNSKTVFCFKL